MEEEDICSYSELNTDRACKSERESGWNIWEIVMDDGEMVVEKLGFGDASVVKSTELKQGERFQASNMQGGLSELY